MAVVGLEHLDIDIVAEGTRGVLDQLEGDVDADAHVGGHDDGHRLRRPADRLEPGFIEARRSDDQRLGVGRAEFQLVQGGGGNAEIHQDVEVGRLGDMADDGNAEVTDAGRFPGVCAQPGRIGMVHRTGDTHVVGTGDGRDQHPTHAPCGAGNGDADGGGSHRVSPSKKFLTDWNQLVSRGEWVVPLASRVALNSRSRSF